jgi:hypothetical protein
MPCFLVSRTAVVRVLALAVIVVGAFNNINDNGPAARRIRVLAVTAAPPAAGATHEQGRDERSNHRNGGPRRKTASSHPSSQTRHTLDDRRRQLLIRSSSMATVGWSLLHPLACDAGEVGARITKAVTQSELGLSVRRSVVEGAQIMDRIDGAWESFSDRFSLGEARSKRPGKPAPKIVHEPLPLDGRVAIQLLQYADDTFLRLTRLSSRDLDDQLERVRTSVRPSFERAGLVLVDDESPPGTATIISTGPQFNFESYVHYKSYSDLILSRTIDFSGPVRKEFERVMGSKVLSLLLPSGTTKTASSSGLVSKEAKAASLKQSLDAIDRLGRSLMDKGLVSSVDVSPLDVVDVEDWSEGLSDLSWSVALDGDVTLGSQILLQEQGYKLIYPNYARYALQSILEGTLPAGTNVAVENYYLDTDYNSDPDKFQVKEVLLNIELLQSP